MPEFETYVQRDLKAMVPQRMGTRTEISPLSYRQGSREPSSCRPMSHVSSTGRAGDMPGGTWALLLCHYSPGTCHGAWLYPLLCPVDFSLPCCRALLLPRV